MWSFQYFCSERVALAYQRMGYLGKRYPPNEYTSHDFSEMGGLMLTEGTLSNEFLIKATGSTTVA